MHEEPSRNEILWRQYNQHTELYKFYLGLALKANIFYYGITGAILTYYFSNTGNTYIKFSLILPVVLSFVTGGIFLYGSFLMSFPRMEMFNIRDELKLETAPDFNILTIFLKAFGIVFLLVGFALLILVFCPELLI